MGAIIVKNCKTWQACKEMMEGGRWTLMAMVKSLESNSWEKTPSFSKCAYGWHYKFGRTNGNVKCIGGVQNVS